MTTTSEAGGAVPLPRRLSLLAGVAAFATVPGAALQELAATLAQERFEAGSAAVTQGETGDDLYLIVEGRAEVTMAVAGRPVPLAMLGPGECFGELALLDPSGERQATVTALTPLLTLSLARQAFADLLAAHPETRAAFEAAAETTTRANFLKRATPFTALDARRLRRLSEALASLSVPAGTPVVRQGEAGDTCYLLRSGKVEVLVREEDGTEQRKATLWPGSLLGEAALLTDAPRNATVRTLEPSELLVLRRAELLEAMGESPQAGMRVVELLRMRDRPSRTPGVQTYERANPDGETITILKDPGRGAYYRLSARGRFLWDRLDGQHTMRDLVLDYMDAFKAFSPQAVAEVAGGLMLAGFLEASSLRFDVLSSFRLAWWQRALLFARRLLQWRVTVGHVDAPLTRFDRAIGHLLFTPPAQLILALLGLAGLAAFFLGSGHIGAALHGTGGSALLLFLIPAYIISIVVHEAGHALATKHFGYEVPRVGAGWYWFSPIAFVDTSDMWLAERRPRIWVSLAGPYSTALLAGLAAIAAWFAPGRVLPAALWQFAFVSYVLVLLNFNPLLEYDGYYVLIDWLERPNLRPRALAWVGTELVPTLRGRGFAGLRGHGLELAYGLGSLLFVVIMAAATVISYRLLLQGWVSHLLPAPIAAALAWVLAVLVVGAAAAGVASELRDLQTRNSKV